MTDRERMVSKALLDVLNKIGQCGEEVLHPAIEQVPLVGRVLVSELRDATREAEKRGWTTGIVGPFGNVKWSITDKGRAARLEF